MHACILCIFEHEYKTTYLQTMKTKKTEYDEQLIPFEPEMPGDEEKLSIEIIRKLNVI